MLITYLYFEHFIKVIDRLSACFVHVFLEKLRGLTNYGLTKKNGFSIKSLLVSVYQ